MASNDTVNVSVSTQPQRIKNKHKLWKSHAKGRDSEGASALLVGGYEAPHVRISSTLVAESD